MTDLGPLFERPAPVHRNPHRTEVEAKEKTEYKLEGFRRQVWQALLKSREKGRTGDELCRAFPGRTESAVRTRLTEMVDAGMAVRTKWTRENRRGNREGVVVAADFFDVIRHTESWDMEQSVDVVVEESTNDPKRKLGLRLLEMAAQTWRPAVEQEILKAAGRALVDA